MDETVVKGAEAGKTPDAGSEGALHGSRWWTTAALLLVMVLASMEATVTSTAMPTIVGALKGLERYSWVMSVYLITQTVTMPLYGRLADVLGRKRVLLFAIAVFAGGSVLASFSHTMTELIVYRGIQGLGAGGIMPVVLTILGDIFTLEQRAKVQGAFSAVWGTASLAGPALGAFLVHTEGLSARVPAWMAPYMGWPTIFWINLPLAAIAVVVLMAAYRDQHKHHAAAPGAGEETSGLWAALKSPVILPCFVTSALMGTGVFALDVYVPLYVQGGRGMSAAAAAACVTPVMLAWASSGVFAAPLLLRWGFRKLAMVGAMLQVVGFVGLLAASLMSGPLWMITAFLFVTGLGFGPASMAMLLAAQDAASYRQRGLVTSGIAFSRNLGGAFGVMVLGMLFNALAGFSRMKLPFAESELLDPHKLEEIRKEHADVLAQAQGAITGALLWVFVAMIVIGGVQWVVSRRLPAKTKEVNKAEAMEGVMG